MLMGSAFHAIGPPLVFQQYDTAVVGYLTGCCVGLITKCFRLIATGVKTALTLIDILF